MIDIRIKGHKEDPRWPKERGEKRLKKRSKRRWKRKVRKINKWDFWGGIYIKKTQVQLTIFAFSKNKVNIISRNFNTKNKLTVCILWQSFFAKIHDSIIMTNSLLFSSWVVADFCWSHGLRHPRLACPSLSPGVCSSSCALSWWCYLTISSFAAPLSFCLRSFPASGSFSMNQLFASGGQSVGASGSASVLPVNIQVFRVHFC